jgi:hypothetical protein
MFGGGYDPVSSPDGSDVSLFEEVLPCAEAANTMLQARSDTRLVSR